MRPLFLTRTHGCAKFSRSCLYINELKTFPTTSRCKAPKENIDGQELAKSVRELEKEPRRPRTKNRRGADGPKVTSSSCVCGGEDHLGTIVVAASKVIGRCQDAEEAEANTIVEGLKLAMDNNMEPSVLKSNCATVVAIVNSKSRSTSRS